jgi:hypothetical protein
LALWLIKGGCHRFCYGQEEDAVFQEDGVYIHLIKKQYIMLGWYLHQYKLFE